MSKEERGRRTWTLALSRHRVGLKNLTDLNNDDPNDAVEAELRLCDVVCTVM